MKVERSWSIAPGEEPRGLALDNQNQLLFSVCGNKLMVVSDIATGKVVTTLPIGSGCDGAAFDAKSFKVLETVKTNQGARTITLDNTTHHLYLSTAEYEATAPGSTGRARAKPGSFMIMDIENVK